MKFCYCDESGKHDLVLRRFRVVVTILVGIMALALLPLFFVDQQNLYLIIWLDTVATGFSVLWIARARLRRRISRRTSLLLAPVVSLTIYGVTVAFILAFVR